MYELVKQKQRGYYLILGIIIFTFLTAVLKIAFHEPETSLNDDLIQAANKINTHTPIVIDSTTRLDRVNALAGHIFQYNFTILTFDRSQIDTISLKSAGRESMISQLKKDPQASIFKENNIEIQAKYVDKDGMDIATFSVYPNEY